MSYILELINNSVAEKPEELVHYGEQLYTRRISRAADRICDNLKNSPIVLVSGPSASGKTTTAQKLGEALLKKGVSAKTIALDNYFKTVDPETAPRDENGEIDLESPDCLDIDLLLKHFAELAKGGEIKIPYYLFTRQRRSKSKFTILRLLKNQVAIFEGIHALNDKISGRYRGAFKLYISTNSNIESNGKKVFDKTWFRLMRRIVRDKKFRNTRPAKTLNLWDNIRRGEKRFINPFIIGADLTLDTSFVYEVAIMKNYIETMCADIPPETENYEVIKDILDFLAMVEPLDEKYIPEESMFREFIGGGIYKY